MMVTTDLVGCHVFTICIFVDIVDIEFNITARTVQIQQKTQFSKVLHRKIFSSQNCRLYKSFQAQTANIRGLTQTIYMAVEQLQIYTYSYINNYDSGESAFEISNSYLLVEYEIS